MRLYNAGSLTSPGHTASSFLSGARHFLISYGYSEPAFYNFEKGLAGYIVELPDEVGEAFLASGLPHTMTALKQWLDEQEQP